jgi:hypothetical protein
MPVTGAQGGDIGVLPNAPLVSQQIGQAAGKSPTTYQYIDSSGTLQSTPDPTEAVGIDGQYTVVDATNNVVLSGPQAGATYSAASNTASGSGGAIVHVPSTQILAAETAQSSATAPATSGSVTTPILMIAVVGAILAAAVLL